MFGFLSPKPEVASHYHKSGGFQDTANREFFGLTQDWVFRSWRISGVRFSGIYGKRFTFGRQRCPAVEGSPYIPKKLQVYSLIMGVRSGVFAKFLEFPTYTNAISGSLVFWFKYEAYRCPKESKRGSI